MRGELTLGTDTVPRSRAAARAKARSGGSQSQAGTTVCDLHKKGENGIYSTMNSTKPVLILLLGNFAFFHTNYVVMYFNFKFDTSIP
jgi:hypothetical protein